MAWRTLTVFLCLAALGHVAAQSPHASKDWLGSWWKTCPRLGCCPDDYDRKPCPAIEPLTFCGGADDYCRKTIPLLTNIPPCGSCDDYCRKPLPSLLCPPWSPFLQCGPASGCGMPVHRHTR